MDVAQMISSAVVPGAATLPTSAESAAGGVAPASLFSEMFAKAATTVELPGKSSGNAFAKQPPINSQLPSPERLLMNAPGAELSAPLLTMPGEEALPAPADPAMTGLPAGRLATLLARAMAHRHTVGEGARTPEQRGLALAKGSKNSELPNADLSEGQLETELLSGSEILLASDIPTKEKAAEGSGKDVSRQEMPHQDNTIADVPAQASVPAGLVSVLVAAPVEQDIPATGTAGMFERSALPTLADAALPAERMVTEAVRETLPAKEGDAVAEPQPQPAVAGKPEQMAVKTAVAAAEKNLASFVMPEAPGRTAVPGQGDNAPSAGLETAPVIAEVTAAAKTAGVSVPAASPEGKAAVESVPAGEKKVGKEQENVARQENGPAMKQAQQDGKVEGKGETVARELPSGVTVLNPAQTVTMGRSTMTADAAPLAVQGSERGRISRSEGEVREEKGRQVSLVGEGEKLVRNKEGFSSQDNPNLGHDSSSNGGNHGVTQTAAASGSFDAVTKGQLGPLSDVPREHEVTALHENILSQVREKLAGQDPTGTVSKITLKLNPHELGELQINVRLEDQKMRVDITAQNPVVKEALLQNLDQLKETLMRQNISMERFHVSTGDGGGQAFNQSFREGRQTAYQTPDSLPYPMSGYYQEDTQVSQATFADSRENSLVDMRF